MVVARPFSSETFERSQPPNGCCTSCSETSTRRRRSTRTVTLSPRVFLAARPWTLVDQPRFRAGFDFMRLRADIGEVDEALADWWQTFSLADDLAREDMLAAVRQTSSHRGRGQAGGNSGGAPKHTDAEAAEPASDAPKRRRRRRRKPAGGGHGGEGNDAA